MYLCTRFEKKYTPYHNIMILKLRWSLLLLILSALSVQAQDKGQALVKGRLLNTATNEIANEVLVAIPAQKRLVTTDGVGEFIFSQVPYGSYQLVIGGGMMRSDTMRIDINSEVVDLGVLNVSPNDAATSAQSVDIPTIALEDNNVNTDDEGVSTQNVSGLLTASNDPFLRTAAFVFGPYRFQPRGYDRNSQEIQINGAPMNDVETGDAYWNQWGGLNDVFRARSNTYGLQPSDYAFGGLNGTVNFDADAASQRKQTRITYSLTNRQYRNRLMLTHSTGLMKNGWAFSLSGSKRWSEEGYVDGTFYDGYSFYAAASKVINGKHGLHLTAFGAPTRRGNSGPVIKEVYDLAGTNFYNPYWGYQNGEKRNSRVRNSFQPAFIFNYEYTPTQRTRWNTAFTYQFGKDKRSRIDYYNGANPAPDYYRYLPSWMNEIYNFDPLLAQQESANIQNAWRTNPSVSQVNWDGLYNANYNNIETLRNINGNPNDSFTGRRSIYILSDDVDDIKKYVVNSTLQHAAGEHATFYTGASLILQRTESYREASDLLGGDYFINSNQFAEREYPGNVTTGQQDLNTPNRLIQTGDRYYYNYISRFNKALWWGQAVLTYNKFDLFGAVSFGFNSFTREGLFRSGLYENSSYGESPRQNFSIYALKGGITYKVSGRHYLFVNGSINQDAPTFDNTFVSPRTRNQTVTKPTEQKSSTLEAGYLLHAPRVNGRLVGYVTDIKDAAEIKRFYSDDSRFESFVNYALTGVNSRFTGIEFALDVKLSSAFNLIGVAAVGQAFYTNRPTVGIYRDNDTNITPVSREVYLKNYYMSVGPQSAYSLGLNYRSKKFWYANLNANYFDRNYIEAAPDRRTELASFGIERNSPQWHQVFDQEKLPSAFTLDLYFGKSFMLSQYSKLFPRSAFLYVNIGVNNLLNNTEIRTGGFEQLRYDYNRPNAFPSKYFYGLGRNYFVNVSLKF